MSASESSISAPAVVEPPPAHPFSWRFTTPLFIGSALNPINSSLIATALVPIARGLGVSIGQTAALITALYLASAIAQPTAGKALRFSARGGYSWSGSSSSPSGDSSAASPRTSSRCWSAGC
jgi:hypothetical protein